jgi:hypothetical protein
MKRSAIIFLILAYLAAAWRVSTPTGSAAGSPALADPPPIQGPFVDPPEAYPHAPAVLAQDLRQLHPSPDPKPHSQVMPDPLRLAPGEERKPFAPQLANWMDALAQTAPGAGQMPEPVSPGFAGLNFSIDGAGWPPDTVGDASLTHYIQAVNISIGIFDLAAQTLLYRGSFNDFFTGPAGTPCESHHRGDPVVLYDQFVNRWLVADFAWFNDGGASGYYQCLAVSRGPDPVASGWYFYALRADTGNFEFYLNDYPKLGAWHDGWYMTANMFQMRYPNVGFGVRVWALDRQAMVQGLPLREVHFDLCTLGDCASLLPAHDNLAQAPLSSPPPQYLLSATPPNQLHLWQFTADFDAPQNSSFSGPAVIPVAPFATAAMVPQRDSFQSLDSLSPRLMMQLQYRYRDGVESLWANHTVASSGVAGVRWYEIQNPAAAAPTLAQRSTYQPDARHRWMGSLAVDQDGNMALGYSISSADLFPAIRIAGRLAPETPSLLPQAEVEVRAGAGSQEFINRWGDYSAMTVSPDGCTFYYTNEYYAVTGTNWQTWIIPLRYPSCGQPKGVLQGVVQDAVTLQPLAGIPIIASSPVLALTLTTDQDGAFSLPLVAGEYTLSAGPLPPGYPVPTQVDGIQVFAGEVTELTLQLTPYPALSVASTALQDFPPGGNSNLTPEPGESGIALQVLLVNSGSIAATNVASALSSLTPGVTLQADLSSYPDIQPGETQSQEAPFTFALDPALPCGAALQLSQSVTDSLQSYSFDLDFDAALPGARQALFTNDVEYGRFLWQTAGVNNTWGIIQGFNLPSPVHAWTDSPVGNYRNNTDASLISPTYNLAGKRRIQVEFMIRYAIEAGWDYLFVEYSLDGGQTWSPEPLASFSGYQPTFQRAAISAPALENQPNVRLRYRLFSDAYITYDGAVIDDIAITFEPYTCAYAVALPPAAPIPLAPMADDLFRELVFSETAFRWLPGASGAPVDGYRLYLDGRLAADLPGDAASLRLRTSPGEHSWSVEAYNMHGVSPQAGQTFFVTPTHLVFPSVFNRYLAASP